VTLWPVIKNGTDIDKLVIGSAMQPNAFLWESLKKQRRYAIIGTALALVGVAVQDIGAALP
jgi:hypothetical protein